MKKATTLTATLYVEGEGDPAADFAAAAMAAVRTALAAGATGGAGRLTVTIKDLQEQTANDDSGLVLPPPLPAVAKPAAMPEPTAAVPSSVVGSAPATPQPPAQPKARRTGTKRSG